MRSRGDRANVVVGKTKVSFGSQNCPKVNAINGLLIIAVAPKGKAGKVDLSVYDTGG